MVRMESKKGHRRDKKILIAILDSGIDKALSDLQKYVVFSKGYSINPEGIITTQEDPPVKNKHGTLIALTIRELCKEAHFLNIHVLSERLTADTRLVMNAFYETLELQPDIIHLSLGTTRWRYRFPYKRLVAEACKRNILVVSAAENYGKRSYPAYLKGVIGVKAQDYENLEHYEFHKGFFTAPARVMNVCGAETLNQAGDKGSSYAAAYITGHISNLLVKGCEKEYHLICKTLLKNRTL